MSNLTAAILASFLCFAVAASAELTFPTLKGPVVDSANLLGGRAEQHLTALLAAHENATGNQVVVATLPDLQGSDIATFANQLARYWAIGQQANNNGVLLIIAKQERKIRIEVGYGLEGQLTDAISANIIHTVIAPAFKKGDTSAGIQAGSRAIIKALGGKYSMNKSGANQGRANKFWMVVFLGIILGPLLSRFLPASLTRSRHSRRHGSYYGGGYYGGGRRSGGLGGGGFSGGGGGFGGGGASGGW